MYEGAIINDFGHFNLLICLSPEEKNNQSKLLTAIIMFNAQTVTKKAMENVFEYISSLFSYALYSL